MHKTEAASKNKSELYRKKPRPLGPGRILCAVLALAGCSTDMDEYLDGGTPHTGSSDMPAGNSDMQTLSGLPCDVANLLKAHCVSCHGMPPAGAPMALVTYQDLTAQSPVMPGQTIAARALLRMQDATNPMPPGPSPTVPANEIAAFGAWVTAGTPPGSCQPMMNPSDPIDAPPQCSSKTTWTQGNQGDPTMHPGRACITCHSTVRGAPKFQVVGTVYPTGHEPDDCYGVGTMAGVTVEITDAAGTVYNVPTNGSGNFLWTTKMATLKLPYHAKVKQGGKERAMTATQMSGDCNSCHSQTGQNGAPGRITVP